MKAWIFLLMFALVAAVSSGGAFWRSAPDETLLDTLFHIEAAAREAPGESPLPYPPGIGKFRSWFLAAAHGAGGAQAAALARSLLPAIEVAGFLLVLWVACLAAAAWWPGWETVSRFFFAAACAAVLLQNAWDHWRNPSLPATPKALQVVPSLQAAIDFAGRHAPPGAGSGAVWFSPAAARWGAVALGGDWGDAIEGAKLAGNPVAWRQAARERGYTAAIFAGRPEEYRPVLKTLQDLPDWRPAFANAHAVVFLAGNRTAELAVASDEEIAAQFPGPQDRATYRALLARQLANLGEAGAARREFRKALDAAPDRADIRIHHASFLAGRQQWPEAVAEARAVLEKYPAYVPALQVLVQAELAAGRPQRAWEAAERLKKLRPHDTFSLYLHARAAAEVGASWAEADSLERLIELTRQQGLPTATYRVFLGQAYARQGLPKQAAEQMRAALASGEIPPGQLPKVEEALRKIEAEEHGDKKD